MHRNDPSAIALAPATLPIVKHTGRTAEKELLVDLHDLVGPKFFRIQNICSEQLGCYPSSKIFDCFTASYQCSATSLSRR